MARVPIHLRAEPGDYAEACLLPGDPLRAKYIAETFFSEPRQVNGERGMLGFTGTFEGRPVSVQASGMGCPSAAIVIEELAMLGVKRIVRVGTCGGLQPDMRLGDLIVAISSAVAADATATWPASSRTLPPPPGSSSTALSTPRKSSASRSAWARSCRAISLTTPTMASTHAGRRAASSLSRWRLRCSSPSAR